VKALDSGLSFLLSCMDVFIKSFNRPYYLERCIRTIHQFVSGDFTIKVLDDGTPQRYLDKIQSLFPTITILKSDSYNEKSSAVIKHIEEVKQYSIESIPAAFWMRSVADASNIFLWLEEDAWFTEPVNVNQISQVMSTNEVVTLKLFWCNNEDIVKGKKRKIDEQIEEVMPELPIKNPAVFSLLMTERLRIRTLLNRAKILSPRFVLPYYGLYTVASAFFHKDYWLAVWKDSADYVREGHQLVNALKWRSSHPNIRYAKTITEKVRTSYITTSVNRMRSVPFDFITFNHVMNEAWLTGELDALHGLPGDFHVDYLEDFLKLASGHNLDKQNWHRWIDAFQKQFVDQGCRIDPL
jgi:hypothetical protein